MSRPTNDLHCIVKVNLHICTKYREREREREHYTKLTTRKGENPLHRKGICGMSGKKVKVLIEMKH